MLIPPLLPIPPGSGVGADATKIVHVDDLIPAAFIACIVKRPESEL